MLLLMFGAALLYGDGCITPAISVLSAVEGLEGFAPRLTAFVLPITLAILLAEVLAALNPMRALGAVSHGGLRTAFLLGGVLAVTGVEALYADMGHFWTPCHL